MICLCRLEESRGLVEVRSVERERLYHAGSENRAHYAQRFAQRIDEVDGATERAVCGQAELFLELRRGERIGDALAVAEPDQPLLDLIAEKDFAGTPPFVSVECANSVGLTWL